MSVDRHYTSAAFFSHTFYILSLSNLLKNFQAFSVKVKELFEKFDRNPVGGAL